MKSAYQSSGQIFEQVSMRSAPHLIEQIGGIRENEIVVVGGTYDHIERLLDTLNIPYSHIESPDFAQHNGGRVAFINCKSYESGVPVKATQEFVREGGRLVSTDWALAWVTKSFPGRLKKMPCETADDVVEIQCSNDIGRRLVGLNYAQMHPQWWLEGSSHVYDIGNGVVPLITSKEMEERYGKPYVMVGFPEGKGEVFHFISHLELQRSRLKTKEDAGSLDDFLEKMGAARTMDMEEATLAELEAAYSTLNTLAHLCIPQPVLNTGMKSVLMKSTGDVPVSKELA